MPDQIFRDTIIGHMFVSLLRFRAMKILAKHLKVGEFARTISTYCYSHRPLSVENIYNSVQTRLVLKHEEVDSDIPNYEQIFRDDEVLFPYPSRMCPLDSLSKVWFL